MIRNNFFLGGEGKFLTIGEKLKEAREVKGLTLQDVQENIKIRKRYLEALENNNFDLIPGEAYIKAFIKGYAGFLELDHLQLFEQYQELKDDEEKKKEEILEEKNKSINIHNKTIISSIIVIVILVVLAFLIYNIFLLNDSRNNIGFVSENDSVQAISDDLNHEDDFENNNSQLNDNSLDNLYGETGDKQNDSELILENKEKIDINTNVNNSEDLTEDKLSKIKSKSVDIIVTERSWIQILVDDQKVFEGILYDGENKSYNYSKTLTMKIGNAAGIKVRKGNRVLGPWGKQGEVIKKTIEG